MMIYIKTPEKYEDIDVDLFNAILKQKPELKKEVLQNANFEILKNKINENDK